VRLAGGLAAAVAALLAGGCVDKGGRGTPVETPELGLGEEWVAPTEAKATADTTEMLQKFVKQHFRKTGHAHRDAHVKPHGCAKAFVQVAQDLPPNLALGVFSQPVEYKAWIRWSNSSDAVKRDRKADGRGMAIKLMNVPGEKAEPGGEDGTSHDFILINYPVFVVRDPVSYVEFTKDSVAGHPLRFFFQGGGSRLPQLSSAGHLATQKVVSPLSPIYYSMTPYQLGDGQAVKYGARPCTADPRTRRKYGYNYLRKQMVEDLEADQCFELMVQVQTDPQKMPIEDPTVMWSVKQSPYVPVARITIPAQDFHNPDQRELCEFLSFNPWHARVENRPLGGINRVRRDVYPAISALRHQLDGVKAVEPTDHDVEAYLQAIR